MTLFYEFKDVLLSRPITGGDMDMWQRDGWECFLICSLLAEHGFSRAGCFRVYLRKPKG